MRYGTCTTPLMAFRWRSRPRHATPESDERLYDDVLSGKRSAREQLSSSHFTVLAMTKFKQYEKERAELSEEERSTLDARAAEAAETLTDPETPERNS